MILRLYSEAFAHEAGKDGGIGLRVRHRNPSRVGNHLPVEFNLSECWDGVRVWVGASGVKS